MAKQVKGVGHAVTTSYPTRRSSGPASRPSKTWSTAGQEDEEDKEQRRGEEQEDEELRRGEELAHDEAKVFQSVAAGLNLVAPDKLDAHYATKELMRGWLDPAPRTS